MPELPEVETIRRGLEKALMDQNIVSVSVRVSKLFHGDPRQLENQTITELARRSKVLIIQLSKSVILVHLKMTGQLIFLPDHGKPVIGGHPDKNYSLNLPHKHTHVIFKLTHGTLYYNDLRKFGWIKVYDNLEQAAREFAKLGPEYTWPEYTLEHILQYLSKRQNITIKQVLLEQSLVAGVGNIYADETLFCAKILPTRKVKDLKPAEVKKIYQCIPKIFELSLKHGGTSSQNYVQLDGSRGNYLQFAKAYKREGQPCKVCKTPIKRLKISGRSAHFCPQCQN